MNRGSLQAKGLVAWWPLAAGKSSLAIELARGNHGTLTNFGTSSTSGWVGGYGGGSCLAFDGTNDFVTASPAVQTWPFTLAGWALTTNTGATATMISLCRTGTTNSWARIVMSGGAGAQVFNIGNNAGGQQDGTATGNLANNVWYHIAVTFDASFNWRYYRNGVAAGNGTFSSFSWNALTATALGTLRFSSDLQFWPGRLEDWRVYDRVLSAAEIYALFDPDTRWQLRYQVGQRAYSIPAGGGGGGSAQPPRSMHQFRLRRAA